MPTEKIKIGLVDPELITREGIAGLINNFGNCAVVLQASNGRELQSLLRHPMPDLIIMEIKMPELDGFKTLEWLHVQYPKLPVMILSSCRFELTGTRLMQLGAKTLLRKNLSRQELLKAIQTVITGEFYYADATMRNLISSHYKSDDKFFSAKLLSENEWKLLQLSGSELTYKEIAQAMYFSVGGLNKIRDNLFRKFNVKNRACLTAIAFQHGICNN